MASLAPISDLIIINVTPARIRERPAIRIIFLAKDMRTPILIAILFL